MEIKMRKTTLWAFASSRSVYYHWRYIAKFDLEKLRCDVSLTLVHYLRNQKTMKTSREETNYGEVTKVLSSTALTTQLLF